MERRCYATDDPDAAMAAATVLISAMRGAGAGLHLAMVATGKTPADGFLWSANATGDDEALALLDTAHLDRLGVVIEREPRREDLETAA